VILLVNDDGIDAPGLRALYHALRAATNEAVLAVAPHVERSGQSQAITLDRGLAVTARHDRGFFGLAVDGTPADCTKLALTVLCPEAPRLVVSGINDGPNTGRSILYSGTLGAALEAAVEGHAALAVSREKGGGGFAEAAEFAAGWARRLLGRKEYRGQVVNLNLPSRPKAQWKDAVIAAHGRSGFDETYRATRDAKDRITWRIHGEWRIKEGDGRSDAAQLTAGHPVLSLLRPDLNAPDKGLRRLLAAKER